VKEHSIRPEVNAVHKKNSTSDSERWHLYLQMFTNTITQSSSKELSKLKAAFQSRAFYYG